MMQELTDKIRTWGIIRGLDEANPDLQVVKLGEEYGEVCRGIARGNHDEVVDGLGDMFVVMVQIAMQHGTSIEYCVEAAYEQIKDRKGKLVNGVFVKESDL